MGGKHITASDSRPLDVATVTPKLRKHFFDKVNEFGELRGDRMLGEASLMSHWVHQRFYQAYLWMTASRSYPVRAFRHELDALAWCEELVQCPRVETTG